MAKRRKQKQTKQTRWSPLIIVTGLLLLGGGMVILWVAPNTNQAREITVNGQVLAEARLDHGQAIYEAQCAACHGLDGEGQPNWKIPDSTGQLPAPPHDSSGHTWHHPDSQLLEIIANGGSLPGSAMPGYLDTLTEEEMVMVLGYIKTFWGSREMAFQMDVTQNATR